MWMAVRVKRRRIASSRTEARARPPTTSGRSSWEAEVRRWRMAISTSFPCSVDCEAYADPGDADEEPYCQEDDRHVDAVVFEGWCRPNLHGDELGNRLLAVAFVLRAVPDGNSDIGGRTGGKCCVPGIRRRELSSEYDGPAVLAVRAETLDILLCQGCQFAERAGRECLDSANVGVGVGVAGITGRIEGDGKVVDRRGGVDLGGVREPCVRVGAPVPDVHGGIGLAHADGGDGGDAAGRKLESDRIGEVFDARCCIVGGGVSPGGTNEQPALIVDGFQANGLDAAAR